MRLYSYCHLNLFYSFTYCSGCGEVYCVHVLGTPHIENCSKYSGSTTHTCMRVEPPLHKTASDVYIFSLNCNKFLQLPSTHMPSGTSAHYGNIIHFIVGPMCGLYCVEQKSQMKDLYRTVSKIYFFSFKMQQTCICNIPMDPWQVLDMHLMTLLHSLNENI